MKPYYYVFNRTRDGAPTYRHYDQLAAVQEAERLAAKHPGQEFEVCKVVALSKTHTVSTLWMDGEGLEPKLTA